jgi:hypothetical protein
MALKRWRWILIFAAVGLLFLVSWGYLVIRSRLGPPNLAVRQYIQENPEVLTTLPQGASEDTRALDDAVEEARKQLLAKATPRLPLHEQEEALALREKKLKAGRYGMTRAETRRLLELDNKCMALLTPAEQQEWRLTMRRLAEQVERGENR